jgi:hypothetical protein
MVGDPGTVVTPVRFVNQGSASGSSSNAQTASATTGQVQGVSTTNSGQTNAPGNSKTSNSNKKGKVLGTETTPKKSSSNTGWYVGGGIVLLLIAAYYWFMVRAGKGWFGNKQS